MMEAAVGFVAGDVSLIEFHGHIAECRVWARGHRAHPEIQKLIEEWASLADSAWNEFGQHTSPLTHDNLRKRIASDLGLSPRF